MRGAVTKLVALPLLCAALLPASGPGRVGAGMSATMLIDARGDVWCWPAPATGSAKQAGLSGALAVTGGFNHGIALMPDGSVRTWGDNYRGQLGDEALPPVVEPIAVAGLSAMKAIAAGSRHSLGVRADGTVWAWGVNSESALGPDPGVHPRQIGGIPKATSVAAGSNFSLALLEDGTVMSWGSNNWGKLGRNWASFSHSPEPQPVVGLTNVVAIAARGDSAYAVLADGTVRSWGSNRSGALGDAGASGTFSLVPVAVNGLSGVAAVAAGNAHAVARRMDGTVWAWGMGSLGQVGDGGQEHRAAPAPVLGLTGVVDIAAGEAHSVALLSDQTLATWGANYSGQLNSGLVHRKLTPSMAIPAAGFAQVAAGERHGVGVRPDGTVWSWGSGRHGQLGTSSRAIAAAPAAVPGLTGVTGVAARGSHTLALRGDGTVWMWGRYWTSLEISDVPVQVPGLGAALAVAAGFNHNLAVVGGGAVRAWGLGSVVPLGHGGAPVDNEVVTVSGLSGIVAVSAGSAHSLALRSDGTVWAWGRNIEGQLGNPNRDNQPTPVLVAGLPPVQAIVAGANYSLALGADGQIWAWGAGQFGQVGLGAAGIYPTPQAISGITRMKAVAANGYVVYALGEDGRVWSWGSGEGGALGSGAEQNRLRPAPVAGLAGIEQVAAGSFHGLALDAAGNLWSWGYAGEGQLGDGSLAVRLTPGVAIAPGAPDAALVIDATKPEGSLNGYEMKLRILNTGSTAMAGPFRIDIPMPAGVTLVSALGPGGICTGWTETVCTHPGPILAGEERSFNLSVVLGVGASPRATVAARLSVAGDTNPANNHAGVTLDFSHARVLEAWPPAPADATGSEQFYTFSFTGPGGADSLGVVNILFNEVLDGRQACYLAYVRPLRQLYLVSDAGGGLMGPIAAGGTGTLSNSQCVVSGFTDATEFDGAVLRLRMTLTFRPSFAGRRLIYLAAGDREGNNTGWQALGLHWVTPTPAATPPSVEWLSPVRTSASWHWNQSVRFNFRGAAGPESLGVVNILLNSALDGRFGCYAAYVVATGTFYLVNDPGTALLPGIPVNVPATAANSQCTISDVQTSTSGGLLSVDFHVRFGPSFAGNKIWYAAARDEMGGNSGWVPMGTYSIGR